MSLDLLNKQADLVNGIQVKVPIQHNGMAGVQQHDSQAIVAKLRDTHLSTSIMTKTTAM